MTVKFGVVPTVVKLSEGRFTVPKEVREYLELKEGDFVIVETEWLPFIGKIGRQWKVRVPIEVMELLGLEGNETLQIKIQRAESQLLREKLEEIAQEAGALFEKLPSWSDYELMSSVRERRPYSSTKHALNILEDLSAFDRGFHVDVSKDIIQEMELEDLEELGVPPELIKGGLSDEDATRIVELVWGKILDRLELLRDRLNRLLERHGLKIEDVEEIFV